ncbi:MAG: nucleotide exchange factor GrpE [Erysipelotrichaceae bacterium]
MSETKDTEIKEETAGNETKESCCHEGKGEKCCHDEKCECDHEKKKCHEDNDEHECKKEDKKHLHRKKDNKEIEKLKEEIIKLKEEAATNKNAYFKAYADTENLKKRLQQEAETSRKYRIQSFASEVLPVIDNLERALQVETQDENLKNYAKGFEMIHQQLISILEKEGVNEIDALNQPFDPNFHQALMQEAKEGVESGIVIEVLQKGYKLKDRVLRASLVKVSE